MSATIVPPHTRTIVELGMGDGRLIEALARGDPQTVYVGIELDLEQCAQAKSRTSGLQNVFVVQGSFADIVPRFPDGSIDGFIAVLPDPSFVDEKKEEQWRPFYQTVYAKLKKPGAFRLVTELTDELLHLSARTSLTCGRSGSSKPSGRWVSRQSRQTKARRKSILRAASTSSGATRSASGS